MQCNLASCSDQDLLGSLRVCRHPGDATTLWFALNRLLHHDVTLAGIAASVYDPCTSALAYFCPNIDHFKPALVLSTRSTSSSKQHMGSVVTVWQDGGTSLLEATARKQGESDGEQEGALSDGSLLASSTDQVTTALHKMGLLSAVVVSQMAHDYRQ